MVATTQWMKTWIAGALPNWRRPASRGRCRTMARRAGPARGFRGRMVLKQVLQILADDQAAPGERFEARRELYRRLIDAGIVD